MLNDILNAIRGNVGILSNFGVEANTINTIQKFANLPLDFNNMDSVKQTLISALISSTMDGSLKFGQLSEIQEMKNTLNINDDEMGEINNNVLSEVIKKVTRDNVVTEDEMKIVEDLQSKLGDSIPAEIQTELAKVYQLYNNN